MDVVDIKDCFGQASILSCEPRGSLGGSEVRLPLPINIAPLHFGRFGNADSAGLGREDPCGRCGTLRRRSAAHWMMLQALDLAQYPSK